ncbi:MAG: hypothetical protein BWK76_22170 [Desulfobulbaceae bacterium A2]|nr:MAG: hypothetical protein BWK76_22170 [Desulfobulbaceae bacterium A2]
MHQRPFPTAKRLQLACCHLAALLCFNRITVRRRHLSAVTGPVLYLGLHRNGALDGLPYLQATPHAAFLLSAQLHRSRLGRLLFPGIAVARRQDRSRGIRADNDQALEHCIQHLCDGGELFVLPEGTSSLGPRHLPFKSGAAHIAHRVLTEKVSLTVVPLAIHYERAWAWQSRVEVVVGQPLVLQPQDNNAPAALRRRFSGMLEDVGINLDSEEELTRVEMLASAATLGSGLAYTDCLKHFEAGIADSLRRETNILLAEAKNAGVLTHQGVPLMPLAASWRSCLTWLVLAPFVILFFATNPVPLLAGHLAGRLLADDRNVIAFWRAMIGVATATLWVPMALALLGMMVGPWALAAYAAITLIGLRLVFPFRRLSVAAYNTLRAPGFRAEFLSFHRSVLRDVTHG